MAVTHMAARRRGDQVPPYALIAERESERDLHPSIARWLAVRSDLAESDAKMSDAAVSGMMIAEEQAFLDVAVANVDCLRCLRRKLAASTAALLEEEEPNPKRVSILLAALTADVDQLLRKN